MTYRSQNNEAEIILNHFKGKTGTLLDCGANDGITFSNSYDLIKAGWKAHLLEPSSVSANLAKLHRANPNVHVYPHGLGARTEVVEFFESGAHVPKGKDRALVSTTVAEEKDRWPAVKFEAKKIQTVSFGEWWAKADFPTLDFISIDCEGMDWEILQEINLAEVGCRCICLEYNTNKALAAQYSQYCEQFGLKEIARNPENIIFVKPK